MKKEREEKCLIKEALEKCKCKDCINRRKINSEIYKFATQTNLNDIWVSCLIKAGIIS